MPDDSDDNRRDNEDNRRMTLVGAVVAVGLLLFGLWLARELTAAGRLQDCVMQGRSNCAVIPSSQ